MSSTDTPTLNQLPPCRVLVRSKRALEIFTIHNDGTKLPQKVKLLDETKCCTSTIPTCMAPDGSFILVHVTSLGIVKCNLAQVPHELTSSTVHEMLLQESTRNVQMMDMSPLGNYLLTWERYHADQCNKNLRIWCTKTGKLLLSFSQKSLSRESWPYLQWTHDEMFALLLVNNTQVRVYNAKDIAECSVGINNNVNTDSDSTSNEPRFCDKLQVSCTTLSVQRHFAATIAVTEQKPISTTYYLTTFAGKTKDKPAVASVYTFTPSSAVANITGDESPISTPQQIAFVRVATKSLFQAEECVTRWSPSIITTPACLMTLSVAVDATGQSYYGNSQLWLWNASAKDSTELIAVPLPQEGPVLSCQWVPDPNKPLSFVVIAGKIPPMASTHHGVTGAVTFLFGNNVHRNTVIFSPHGRFVCLAGFGNMPGGMGFWDMNKKKLIPHSMLNVNGTLQSDTPVTMHSWSPDSRYFLTATTAPRMNVENGMRLYKYTGEIVTDIIPWNNSDYQPNLLYEACFVPTLPSVYPDRPQSPVPELNETERTASATNPASATVSKLSTKSAYVPPSARNSSGLGNSLAERLRREKEGTLQGATKVTKAAAMPSASLAARAIPGLTIEPSGKSKSQVKRDKLKQKKEQQQPISNVTNASSPVEAPTLTPLPSSQPDTINTVDPEKRARKLKKMLKQIGELKLLPELNDDQKSKIASEASIVDELKSLGL
jgi:translation initiation factor 2A